ncbi:MAG: HipA N-terminal domain-containing protein [Myxococcota bacterium]
MTVGRLTVRPGVFVFEYAEDFKNRGLPAIPSLPDVDRAYESEVLFPFFQVRLPPKSRADVADAIAERQISTDDTFEMLRVLGERSVASPYRFADVV